MQGWGWGWVGGVQNLGDGGRRAVCEPRLQAPVCALSPHPMSLLEHGFKDNIIQTFSRVTAEPQP